MVARLHDAGLEVILDVVYNHTAEGNELGPTLSFKGIDNATYYRLAPDQPRYYINDTGTGNTLNLSHPRVLQMVTDSLRYWVTEMHVDGFRFDLGTILAREPYGFDDRSGFLDACRQDPVLDGQADRRALGLGPGGYQVGGFPPGWAEWNDRTATPCGTTGGRRGSCPSSPRGSRFSDLFNHRGRRPWASVNFVTAHDGFTLNDLVSYNDKHNEANGEENRDGSSDNRSWNCGAEGPTDDPAIRRCASARCATCWRRCSLAGHADVLGGDEFGRTQQGNNNAYCQDNEISWIDWARHGRRPRAARLRPADRDPPPATRCSGARASWSATTTRSSREGRDLARPRKRPRCAAAWDDANGRCFGMLLDGRAQATGIRRRGSDETLLLVRIRTTTWSTSSCPRYPGARWKRLIDTNDPDRGDLRYFKTGEEYAITGRSVLLFAGLIAGEGARAVRRIALELSRGDAITT